MDFLQRSDLEYWEASVYWMRHLLRGRLLKPNAELVLEQYPFGNPQSSGIRVVPLGYDYRAEDAFRLVDPGVKAGPGQLKEAAHAAVYREYFDKGRQFAR